MLLYEQMSFFKKDDTRIDVDAAPTFFLELSPTMKPISEFKDSLWQAQIEAIKSQQNAQSDLNRIMELNVETDKGTTTYSMKRAFKNLVTAEDMLELMQKHDVTMRMNIMRNNAHSANHTCMELSSNALSGLLKTESDDGLKTVHLRTSSDIGKDCAAHGDMFVTMRQTRNGTHFFSHVDYSITDDANAILGA